MATPPDYDRWIEEARQVFTRKRDQYGESWRALSFPSLVDLLTIKAHRLQTLYSQNRQENPATGEKPVEDWLSLINYGALALSALDKDASPDISEHLAEKLRFARHTLAAKNADYGNAWRLMRPLTFAEFILMKLERIRQMDHDLDRYRASIRDNLIDIINYAILFLCRYGDEICTR